MPPLNDTIVARASAPGAAARAIVRISGPGARGLASRLCRPAPERPGVRRVEVSIGGGRCPALALWAEGPASFTGEDTLELVVPANPHLVERLTRACCAVPGVRRAGPGEFSARAYLNNRITLDRAEGVAALIAARSAEDLEAARRLATGRTGRRYARWAAEVATLLALVEAGIDFTEEEDVVPIAPGALADRLDALLADLEAHAQGVEASGPEGLAPLVVLAGAPNAGKSTLFNALLGRERAVVADEVGTTRDVIVETLRLGEEAGPGLAVRLADLPGLEADPGLGPAAARAQHAAREALASADAALLCDPLGRFEPPEGLGAGVPVVRVRTKADLPGGGPGGGRVGEALAVCALDGWRLDALRRAIADAALRVPGGSCAVALGRHAGEIAGASEALREVIASLERSAPSLDGPELVAEGLRRASERLERVIGRISPDDVLGRVFATFCVGK
jgi:tRNA modification GTPase